MDPEIFKWVKAVHVLGFLLWTGSLLTCLHLLAGHPETDDKGGNALTRLERRAGMMMDMGALVAIVAGLYLALWATPINFFTDGGWLHIKTTLVVGLVALHVIARVKVRKFRNGESKPLPSFVIPLTLVLITVIVIFAVVKPLR